MDRPRIEVVLDGVELDGGLSAALRATGAEIDCRRFDVSSREASRAAASPTARLLLTGDPARLCNGKLHRLFDFCEGNHCATLVVGPRGTRVPPIELDGRPIAFASGLSRTDVAARLAGMCTAYSAMAAMQDEIRRLRCREQSQASVLSQRNEAIRLAGRVQRDLLPDELPQSQSVRFCVSYCPANVVGGDIYDIVRLDDSRIAFWLADAAGHDVSAGMIAAVVQGLFREAVKTRSSAIAPDRLLARVNRELCELDFSECQFVTAVYGVYDETHRSIRLARAGAPHPMLARANGDAARIQSCGPILGMADADADCFVVCDAPLAPGDGLLVYTDGLEELLARGGSEGEAPPSGLCGPISWIAGGLALAIDEARGEAEDDISFLALEAI